MHLSFETQRVVLRAFEPEDSLALYSYLNDPSLNGIRCIPWQFSVDLPLSKRQVENVLKTWSEADHQSHLAVMLKQDDSLIGHVNANWGWDPHCPNLDLVISPAYQRQGYGSEVLTLMLDYFFSNTPAHNISGGTPEWNQPALNFGVKNGFTKNGRFRRTGFMNGEYVDWIGIDILRPEWFAHPKKGGA